MIDYYWYLKSVSPSMDAPAGGRGTTVFGACNHLQNRRGRGHENGAHAVIGTSPPLFPASFQGDGMTMIKQGNVWRWNDRGAKHLFRNNLRALLKERNIKATTLASFIGRSVSEVSRYMGGTEMPPSDIQEIIALYLGCKSRADVWTFRRDLFPELREINELTSKLNILEKDLQQKIESEYCNGAG